MRVKPMIFFSGFLGSGKTSLLLETVKYLSNKKINCAIIVNEAGEIGIDNLQMKKLGYDVWELFGGCICCTLSVNLETALKQLDEFDVDVILMEPSGAAEPSSIYHTLEHCGYSANDIINYYILDALRIEMLTQVLEPLLTSSLPLADKILINKIDLATDEEIALCEQTARKNNQQAAVLKLSLKDGLSSDYTHSLEKFMKERKCDVSKHL